MIIKCLNNRKKKKQPQNNYIKVKRCNLKIDFLHQIRELVKINKNNRTNPITSRIIINYKIPKE